MTAIRSFLSHSLRKLPETPIEYSSGAPKTCKLAGNYPISRLRLRLSGAVTVTTQGGTLSSIWRIIKQLRVKVNGKDVRVDLEGWMLPLVSWIDNGWPDYGTEPTGFDSTGSKTFDVTVEIPFDYSPQSYFSLFNGTRVAGVNDATVEVVWGGYTDAVSGGVGSIASSTKVEISAVNVVAGGDQRRAGGLAVRYPRRYLDFTKVRITASAKDIVALDGLPAVAYHRFLAIAFTGSTPVRTEALINGYTLRYKSDILSDETAAMIRHENVNRYHLSSTNLAAEQTWKGAYCIDLIDPYMFNQMQASDPSDTANLKLHLDCTVVDAATDVVYFLRDYFQG